LARGFAGSSTAIVTVEKSGTSGGHRSNTIGAEIDAEDVFASGLGMETTTSGIVTASATLAAPLAAGRLSFVTRIPR